MNKINSTFLFLFVVAIGLLSCNKQVSLEEQIVAMGKRQKALPSLKSPAYRNVTDSLYHLIDSFVELNVDHPKSPAYLMKLAEYKNSKDDVLGGAETFKLLQKRYPEDELAPAALLRAALIYQSSINDLVHSKKLFNRLIKEYPDSEEAKNAKANLEFLNSGLTAEEYLNKKISERIKESNSP